MIQKELKYFADPNGRGCNADDDYFAVEPYQIVNGENIRTGTTDAGFTATVESIGSNVRLSEFEPSVTFVTIGVAEDTENRRTINFKCCLTGPWDRIECYSATDKVIYIVILSSQILGGLNFDKDHLIHSARVVDGLLYWTDNLNRQRKVNIDRGIKLNQPSYNTALSPYTDPINEEVISLLKRPPLYPLIIQKVTQPSINNFIKNGDFQFCARYYYKDGETSVLSTYSLLAPYGYSADTSNRIDISFPENEFIDQDVQRVDLVVRYGNTNNYFVINSWDKNNVIQAEEIRDHNDGVSTLSYSFYNNKIGEALDVAYAIKPFESIPRLSETLEVAKNRLFLANNLIGYNTPSATFDITASFTTTESGADVTATWYRILYRTGGHTDTVRFFLYVVGGGVMYDGYYDYPPRNGSGGTLPAPGLTIPWADLIFIGTTQAAVAAYYGTTVPAIIYFGINGTGFTAIITGAPFTTSLAGQQCFKSDASYQIGIVFYDFGDRKCGIATNENLIFPTPDRDYDSVAFTTSLDWSLSNTNAVNEIPDWATHYSVVISKCLRTRNFLQSRVKNLTYVTKDVDGLYIFNTSAYSATLNGVGIDITLLNSYGMGYVFADGDLVKIWLTGNPNPFTLSIVGQDGNWIICELQDLGAIGNTGSPYTTALFEIYTPYQPSTNEPLFEVAQTFPVTNAGRPDREYSTLQGSIRGDVTLLERSDSIGTYLTENMSPNDKYYKIWDTDAGRPNFIDNIGQTVETNTIAYSNTFISGSRVNGLSSFEALNEKTIPLECGAIEKLQVTSKVQDEQGIVMLCICVDETASLYIEESQQYGSNTSTTLTIFTDVIGTINVLKGSFGTLNPESVIEYRGMVFWFDAINGRIIQYSVNGLFPVSDYKMRRFWKLFSDQYLSMTTEQIEALGSRPYIFGGVDPYHNEVLFAIPKLLDYPPKGYLPDYPNTIFPFDIYDGQAKTMVFKLSEVGNSYWYSPYTWTPDYFSTLESDLLSYKQGQTYLHNSTTSFNNFYGVQYRSKIMFVLNQLPDKPKVYNAMGVQSNFSPEFVYFYNNYPIQQSSDLEEISFNDLEGIWYATILRNKLVPTATGFTTNGLLTGEKMRNVAMLCMVQWLSETEQLELKFISVSFSQSRGHLKV